MADGSRQDTIMLPLTLGEMLKVTGTAPAKNTREWTLLQYAKMLETSRRIIEEHARRGMWGT